MPSIQKSNLIPGKDFVGVGVGGVVVLQRKILLLFRKKPPECNHWTLPGGAIEFGERVEEALLRELREEIGVEARVVTPLGLTDQILPTEKSHWVCLRFLVEVVTGEPKNASPESHLSIGWFALDALPNPLTLTARDGVIAYRAWLQNLNA
jgi:8-oxo-dGTP diphosphatase